jgi:hypothetical protein
MWLAGVGNLEDTTLGEVTGDTRDLKGLDLES